MYQKYRPQKKSSPWWPKALAIIFAIAVLWWGLWYLPKMWEKVEQQETIDTTTQTWSFNNRYVGKKISLAGDITVAENQSTYSHTLTLSWSDEKAHIMSSTIDLNGYNGFVYIQWTVSKFDGKNFIVDISAIWNSPEELQNLSLPTSSNSIIIPSLGLKIDLKDRTDISYSNSGNTYIFQANNISWTMSLYWFRCEAWFPEKDCDTIAKSHTDGSFVSAWWLTFNKWEKWWFAYNNVWVGYTIKTESDTLLYKVSNALIPLNETYIKTLLPTIQKLCNTKNTTPTTIQKETMSTWKVQIPSCTVRITFSESGEDIAVVQQNGSTTGANTTPSQNTATNQLPANTTTAPNLKGTWLVYTSTRWWYNINFPSAKITYNGANIQEDLWVKWLSCYVRLDIKDYKDKDNTAVWPAVAIYECISKESSSSLSSKASGYIFKTNKDGTKLFFIKTLNAARSEFAQKITIQ